MATTITDANWGSKVWRTVKTKTAQAFAVQQQNFLKGQQDKPELLPLQTQQYKHLPIYSELISPWPVPSVQQNTITNGNNENEAFGGSLSRESILRWREIPERKDRTTADTYVDNAHLSLPSRQQFSMELALTCPSHCWAYCQTYLDYFMVWLSGKLSVGGWTVLLVLTNKTTFRAL